MRRKYTPEEKTQIVEGSENGNYSWYEIAPNKKLNKKIKIGVTAKLFTKKQLPHPKIR